MSSNHSPVAARPDRGDRLDEPPSTPRWKVAGLSAAILVAVLVASQVTELFINRVLRPDLEEWTWISEVIMVAAFLVVLALWARLRLARTAIADLERTRLTIHAELAVAAKDRAGKRLFEAEVFD